MQWLTTFIESVRALAAIAFLGGLWTAFSKDKKGKK